MTILGDTDKSRDYFSAILASSGDIMPGLGLLHSNYIPGYNIELQF